MTDPLLHQNDLQLMRPGLTHLSMMPSYRCQTVSAFSDAIESAAVAAYVYSLRILVKNSLNIVRIESSALNAEYVAVDAAHRPILQTHRFVRHECRHD